MDLLVRDNGVIPTKATREPNGTHQFAPFDMLNS
jgi:hypothetical protein